MWVVLWLHAGCKDMPELGLNAHERSLYSSVSYLCLIVLLSRRSAAARKHLAGAARYARVCLVGWPHKKQLLHLVLLQGKLIVLCNRYDEFWCILIVPATEDKAAYIWPIRLNDCIYDCFVMPAGPLWLSRPCLQECHNFRHAQEAACWTAA